MTDDKSSKVSLIQRVTAAWHRHEISTDLCNDLRRALESLPVETQPAASNEQVYRDALVAIRDRLQLRRKSHEDTQRDNDYAYQNANEALFATGAGFARVSDETSEKPDVNDVFRAGVTQAKYRYHYKEALEKIAKLRPLGASSIGPLHGAGMAEAFAVAAKIAQEALGSSPEETTAPPRPSDEVSAPEKACDHYWHTDGYCVKCEMPQQKASECNCRCHSSSGTAQVACTTCGHK